LYVHRIIILIIGRQANNLGYSKGKRIAKSSGKELEEEILSDDESSSSTEDVVENLAAKFFRFFTHNERDEFALFVEHGINRVIEALLSPDHHSIDLTVKIPLPPDGLLQAAGFHASTAHLEEVNEVFKIDAPKKLDSTSKKVIYYPNAEVPIWMVFWYKFVEEKEEAVDKCSIDLSSKLFT
jgi:hypothetical protein